MANILVVDDNPDLTEVQKLVLTSAGHTVTTARDGHEALQFVRTQPFNLVVTDIVMPGGDGIEMIMELHRTLPSLRIIATSGGGNMDAEGYLEVAQKLGATKTMVKPFSGIELIAAVTEMLERK